MAGETLRFARGTELCLSAPLALLSVLGLAARSPPRFSSHRLSLHELELRLGGLELVEKLVELGEAQLHVHVLRPAGTSHVQPQLHESAALGRAPIAARADCAAGWGRARGGLGRASAGAGRELRTRGGAARGHVAGRGRHGGRRAPPNVQSRSVSWRRFCGACAPDEVPLASAPDISSHIPSPRNAAASSTVPTPRSIARLRRADAAASGTDTSVACVLESRLRSVGGCRSKSSSCENRAGVNASVRELGGAASGAIRGTGGAAEARCAMCTMPAPRHSTISDK